MLHVSKHLINGSFLIQSSSHPFLEHLQGCLRLVHWYHVTCIAHLRNKQFLVVCKDRSQKKTFICNTFSN
uniref:Uncharacterized protein n=1 Tax=Arundo donax TaxID=35708 RepID=A0A0A9CYF2_ARUDO